VIKDAQGNITEIRCTYDPATRSGEESSDRKVKGTIHWVSAEHALPVEVRLYDRLFNIEAPDGLPGDQFLEAIHPDSLRAIEALVEPSLATARSGDRFQFERQGYFCVDPDSRADRMVLNRIVGLRDTWAKLAKQGG
jgi:glutaminyl-tRNA synthetase